MGRRAPAYFGAHLCCLPRRKSREQRMFAIRQFPYTVCMNRTLIRPFLLIQASLAAICFSVEGFCRFVLHLRYPYDCPIFVYQGDFFPDFILLIDRLFVHIHTLAFFAPGDRHFMYPPGATLLYEPFAILPSHRVKTYVTLLILDVLVTGFLFARALIRRGAEPRQTGLLVTALILLSYPLWFEMQRGNTEMFIWAITAGGIWAFYRGKGYTAATCFALVGSMKIYPAIFLGLFLSRREYRPILYALGLMGVITVACLWMEYPNVGISLHETLKGLHTFEYTYVQHKFPDVISYDHSLFTLYKRVVQPSLPQLARASKLYMPLFGLLGIVLFFTRIRHLPFSNQVLALTVATVLFPPVSFDYTLLHLYTPFALLLVLFWNRAVIPTGVRFALGLLACLVSPLTEFIHDGHSLEGQLKAVLLTTLFVISLVFPMQEAVSVTADERETELPAQIPQRQATLA